MDINYPGDYYRNSTLYSLRDSYKVKEENTSTYEEWVSDFDFPRTFKVLPSHFAKNNLPVYILTHLIESELIKTDERIKHSRYFGNELLYSNYKWLAPIRAKAKRTYEGSV